MGDSLGQWVESEDGDSRRGDSRLVSPGKKFLELKGERLGGKRRPAQGIPYTEPRRNTAFLFFRRFLREASD